VDADHIRLETVDRFIPHSDFSRLTWRTHRPAADASALNTFVSNHGDLAGRIAIPNLNEPMEISRGDIERIAGNTSSPSRRRGVSIATSKKPKAEFHR